MMCVNIMCFFLSFFAVNSERACVRAHAHIEKVGGGVLQRTEYCSDTNAGGFVCRTQATLAGAVTLFRCLPEKLNPVIKPLMESIKKEENEQLQVC